MLREKYANRLLITEEQTLQEQLTAARYSATNELIKVTPFAFCHQPPTDLSHPSLSLPSSLSLPFFLLLPILLCASCKLKPHPFVHPHARLH